MATITAVVTPNTTPPSVTLVAAGGVGVINRIQGGVATPVRGTDAAFVGTILDYGAPQETPVTYTFAGATSVAVEMPDVGVWLIPAARPELASQLTVSEYPSWSRPVQQWATEVPGRANDVVISSSKRGSRRGSLVVVVLDPAAFAVLDACLEVTGAMLLSTPAGHWPLESRLVWVTVGDVGESSAGSIEPTWLLTLPLTRVDRPAVVAVIAGHRWVDQVGTWRVQVGTWVQQ